LGSWALRVRERTQGRRVRKLIRSMGLW
jgi:hypothetical protein